MSCEDTERRSLWVIACGNRERGDDGVGPYVVESLARTLGPREQVKFLVLEQLDPEIVEDLRQAGAVLFVDASVGPLEGGWQWRELEPDIRDIHFTSHQVRPSYLLGLTLLLYGRRPEAGQLAIQGECFGLGKGLSRETRRRADALVGALAHWLDRGLTALPPWPGAEEKARAECPAAKAGA